jgi:hypothetical protein
MPRLIILGLIIWKNRIPSNLIRLQFREEVEILKMELLLLSAFSMLI